MMRSVILLILVLQTASFQPSWVSNSFVKFRSKQRTKRASIAEDDLVYEHPTWHSNELGFIRFPQIGSETRNGLYEAAKSELRESVRSKDALYQAMGDADAKTVSVAFVEALINYIYDVAKGEPTRRIIPKGTLMWILALSSTAFMKEDSCVEIKGGSEREVVIIGDIHGQLDDVMHILGDDDIAGIPNAKKVLVFNGDLVDRGEYGTEIVALVSALKAHDPECIQVIRGNHESFRMTERFGFQEEVATKYSDWVDVNFMFQRLFQSLPLAAFVSVDGKAKVFISHGGIGRETHDMTLAEIAAIDRHREPWEEQAAELEEDVLEMKPETSTVSLSELLWADPVGGAEEEWAPNRSRGLPGGFLFSESVCDKFLLRNNLSYIVRSHQPPPLGFKGYWSGKCYTVFSASNYCGTGNQGAVLRLFRGGRESIDPSFIQYMCT